MTAEPKLLAECSDGLHLFHTDISNCCDRVRIALEEKCLQWQSHFYVLPRGDHLNEEFFQINPKGVVPVLIDEGQIYTESNDIIDYLDNQYSEPSLRPDSRIDRIKMQNLMVAAGEYHPYIAALSFEFLFSAAPYSQEFFKKRAALKEEVDPKMEAIFDRSQGGVIAEKVKEAIIEANTAFTRLDKILADNEWLVGKDFSLADISWAVQIHRLKTVRLRDIDNYPNLVRWYAAIEKRESAKRGMLDWESPEPYALFNAYLDEREATHTDVNAPIWRD